MTPRFLVRYLSYGVPVLDVLRVILGTQHCPLYLLRGSGFRSPADPQHTTKGRACYGSFAISHVFVRIPSTISITEGRIAHSG